MKIKKLFINSFKLTPALLIMSPMVLSCGNNQIVLKSLEYLQGSTLVHPLMLLENYNYSFMPQVWAIDSRNNYYEINTFSPNELTYNVTSGILPEGIQLDNATGEISGSSSAEGTYTVQITAHGTTFLKNQSITTTVDFKIMNGISLSNIWSIGDQDYGITYVAGEISIFGDANDMVTTDISIISSIIPGFLEWNNNQPMDSVFLYWDDYNSDCRATISVITNPHLELEVEAYVAGYPTGSADLKNNHLTCGYYPKNFVDQVPNSVEVHNTDSLI